MNKFEKRVSIFSLLSGLMYATSAYINPVVTSTGGDPIIMSLIHTYSLKLFWLFGIIVVTLVIVNLFKKKK